MHGAEEKEKEDGGESDSQLKMAIPGQLLQRNALPSQYWDPSRTLTGLGYGHLGVTKKHNVSQITFFFWYVLWLKYLKSWSHWSLYFPQKVWLTTRKQLKVKITCAGSEQKKWKTDKSCSHIAVSNFLFFL